VYLADGPVEINNNLVEIATRPTAVGIWLFFAFSTGDVNKLGCGQGASPIDSTK
jgi:hypothetical protein